MTAESSHPKNFIPGVARRLAAVAGRFYSADPETLTRDVRQYLDADAEKTRAIGVVAPHAGFVYSGGVAGSVYSRVKIPRSVLLIGPNHTGRGQPVALAGRDAWSLPNGDVEIDDELADALLAATPIIKVDDRAHSGEHSLETQIPFMQYFRKDFKIAPICLARASWKVCEELGRAVAEAIEKLGEPVLIVASSDMTHYESDESAREKDRSAIDAMLALDPEALHRVVEEKRISMCGVNPATVMLSAANRLGAKECELVRYATSGDVNGDLDQVVGYAGLIVK